MYDVNMDSFAFLSAASGMLKQCSKQQSVRNNDKNSPWIVKSCNVYALSYE
jgi:hypothetical protein